MGGDFAPERLLAAYSQGIFPWPHDSTTLLWFSPSPRMVLEPAKVHVSRSLRKTLRRRRFEVAMDVDFESVIRACAGALRQDQRGTWITDDLLEGYLRLHRMGVAHSVECRLDGELVGGLYGVSLGRTFFGESMFAKASDASKVALVWLARQFEVWGFRMMDCQMHTPHLESLGAVLWPRERFEIALEQSLGHETRVGRWRFDEGFEPSEMKP